MRISKFMAVAASGCALAAAVTLPAMAGTAHHSVRATHQFPSTLTPKTVHPGQTLTLKGHGAKKSTKYDCVLGVYKGAKYAVGPITVAKSTKKGKLTCKVTYHPYTGSGALDGQSNHKCPVTKKDKKAGWRCGLAASTLDKSSATIGYFTGKK